jgi:hypothetical protein
MLRRPTQKFLSPWLPLLVAPLAAATMASCGGGSDTTSIVTSGALSGGGMAPAAAPAPAPGITDAVFPLHVAASKRYLIDAAGTPFLMQGDSPWSLMVQLTREQVDQYLDDRRARGFNTLLTSLIEHYFADNPPRNAYGDAPFLTPGDFGTPNERYFAHVDWVLQRAKAKGFLVLLVPAYLGYNGGNQGWYSEMLANGSAKLRQYGRYLGQRYAGYGNILWTHGGDYNTPNRSIINEIVAGIREFDSTALHSAHCAPESAATVCASGEPWLQVDNIYTRGSIRAASMAEYNRTGTLPFFLIEGRYEDGGDGTEQRVRQQAYQTLLSGAMGQVFGNNPIWHFDSPTGLQAPMTWQQALDSRGAKSMTHLRTLFAPRPWWTMEPDAANTTLTSGLSSGTDLAVAARAADRSFAIAYMPSLRTITVNLGQLAGPKVAARWYDPANGTYSAVTGSPFLASGSQSFRPAGNNASNYGDWALVLESSQ